MYTLDILMLFIAIEINYITFLHVDFKSFDQNEKCGFTAPLDVKYLMHYFFAYSFSYY